MSLDTRNRDVSMMDNVQAELADAIMRAEAVWILAGLHGDALKAALSALEELGTDPDLTPAIRKHADP